MTPKFKILKFTRIIFDFNFCSIWVQKDKIDGEYWPQSRTLKIRKAALSSHFSKGFFVESRPRELHCCPGQWGEISVGMRYKKLGKRLKNYRIEAGLSQLEVAKAFRYSTTQFISNWERGYSYPPFKNIIVLAEMYKISDQKLFGIIHTEIIKI